MNVIRYFTHSTQGTLTLYLLMWRIWWSPNNASSWQMGFISAFKGLKSSKPVPVTKRSKAWVCGFESCWGHGRLPLEIIVCYHAEVSASGWSLVQRFPTECGISECDREASTTRRPWPIGGGCATRDRGGWGRREVSNIKMNSRISQWFMKHIQT